MEVFEGHRAMFRPLSVPVVALGNFDGVHRGHRQLLDETVRAAKRLGGDAVVFTFDPHPATVLAPDLAPKLITTRDRKLELLAERGISVCVLEPFTRELARLTPEQFVAQVLVQTLRANHVVVGFDFTFGQKRAGTTQTLTTAGAAAGFTTQIIDAVHVDGVVASSTNVRNLVASGDTTAARVMLGRNFDVDGCVVHGAGRGRTIGVPTANVASSNQLMPPEGVYAVWVTVLDDEQRVRYPGVANLGTRPTFTDGDHSSLEVHLLDFDRDLYRRPLRTEFVQRLRGECRFSGVDELVAQIQRDISAAREALDSSNS